VWFNPLVRGLAGSAAVAILGIGATAGCGGDGSGSGAADAPHFVADPAAIDHRYEGDFQYFVGGGVAAFDCDDDGRSELFFAGGRAPAALYHNDSPTGGALAFTQLPSPVTDLDAVTGAYPLDIDGDGHTDLAVLRLGQDEILRGLGDCRFVRADAALGIDDTDSWTVAFSATWEGSNELPTLAFGGYLAPDHESCADGRLLRPAADGGGYAPAVALAPGYCALSMLFSDWSRSGQRDLRVTNDRHYYRDGSDQLWRIEPDEPPRLYTTADGWRPLQVWGMGIASQDITGDGLPEVFLTSQGDNKLQTLAAGPAQPTYEDIALARGATAHRPFTGGDVLPSTAWHDQFADVNNDGVADLFIAKGNVDAEQGYATRDPSNLLIGRPDGTFVEGAEAAGILSYERARGAAVVDLNLDGMLDLVVVNRAAPVSLWRNVGRGDADRAEPVGTWAAIRLHQATANPDAIGAWVETRVGDRTTVHEVTVGGGHASGQLGWIHLGLGRAEQAEVRVQWPDGETGPWMTVGAGHFATIERGATQATPWIAPS
jgi:enediyne biosynthesis protein E4